MMSIQECWVIQCHRDLFTSRLNSLIANHHLVDICPSPLSPTWNNGIVGEEHFGKILDSFFVHENIVEFLGNMKSWVEGTYLLYHLLIALKWRRENAQLGIPFKFNRVWLEDEDFNMMVISTCMSVDMESRIMAMHMIL